MRVFLPEREIRKLGDFVHGWYYALPDDGCSGEGCRAWDMIQ